MWRAGLCAAPVRQGWNRVSLQEERNAVGSLDPAKGRKLDRRVRTLKIEEDGDFISGRIKPKIRLMGLWLERAGFKPGTRVSVTCLGSGVIELRSDVTSRTNEAKQAASDGLDCPF